MTFLWIIAGCATLLLGVGGYVFFRACTKPKSFPWLDRDALLQSKYRKHADGILWTVEWLQEHSAEDVWVKSDDGLKLHGLWVPAEKPIATIMLIHGYHSTYLIDFGRAIAFYHRLGCNVLLPDQRCHGMSEGRFVTFGVKESRDMLCWLSFLGNNLWDGPVILSGMSMGASTVMYMAGEYTLPEIVKGLIVDCGFSTPAAIIGKVFTDVTHLPEYPWIFATEIFTRIFAGFSLWEKSGISQLKANNLPIFMAHGLADDFVPCDMTRQAFQTAGGDKELMLVENAGHGMSFPMNRDLYREAVIRLLKKALGETYELRNN